MSDLRKENETGEVIDEQIGEQDGGFSNMWRSKGKRRATFSTAAGTLNVICIPGSSWDFFFFFFFSFSFFFFLSALLPLSFRGKGGGLGSGRGVPESPDRKSLASCAVFGVQETGREVD